MPTSKWLWACTDMAVATTASSPMTLQSLAPESGCILDPVLQRGLMPRCAESVIRPGIVLRQLAASRLQNESQLFVKSTETQRIQSR